MYKASGQVSPSVDVRSYTGYTPNGSICNLKMMSKLSIFQGFCWRIELNYKLNCIRSTHRRLDEILQNSWHISTETVSWFHPTWMDTDPSVALQPKDAEDSDAIMSTVPRYRKESSYRVPLWGPVLDKYALNRQSPSNSFNSQPLRSWMYNQITAHFTR